MIKNLLVDAKGKDTITQKSGVIYRYTQAHLLGKCNDKEIS